MSTQFAIDASNRLIHISEAERGLSCNCFCVVCGERMMAKKGDEREHHFAHESNKVACVLNHETLLHKFAKRVIQEVGGLIVPPIANQGLVRRLDVSNTSPSWLMFERIEEEQWLDGIRPDLIGYAEGTRVLIEVAFSSFADADKIAKLEALGLFALEIDLRAFPPEAFDPDLAREAILNDVNVRTWLLHSKHTNCPQKNYVEEIITIKGIWVSLKELPFGDLAVKVIAFNPEVNTIVKAIAKRYYGRWRQDYKNWIVPARWLEHAKNDLRSAADSV